MLLYGEQANKVHIVYKRAASRRWSSSSTMRRHKCDFVYGSVSVCAASTQNVNAAAYRRQGLKRKIIYYQCGWNGKTSGSRFRASQRRPIRERAQIVMRIQCYANHMPIICIKNIIYDIFTAVGSPRRTLIKPSLELLIFFFLPFYNSE